MLVRDRSRTGGIAARIRANLAVVLLIVGVLYPEDKTSLGGFHWPPAVALLGIACIVVLKPHPLAGSVTGIRFVMTTLVVLASSLLLAWVGLHVSPDATVVLRQFLTLILTTTIAYLLVSDIDVDLLLGSIHRFMFAMTLVLLSVRLAQNDFSREGTFLGLGPLTFAKYICCGWIAHIVRHGRIGLLVSSLYIAALGISDSKGPILFGLITVLAWIINADRRRLVGASLIAVSLGVLFAQTGRFQAFVTDLESIRDVGLVTPELAEIAARLEDESLTSTMARIFSLQASTELIRQRPVMGWGTGSWPTVTGLEALEYPHNSILHIWFEYGAVGLAVFVTAVAAAAMGVLRGNPFSPLVIFCGLLSLTTGSIRDLRLLMFFVLLAWSLRDIRFPVLRERAPSRLLNPHSPNRMP
jgi:O-antigen ligase